MKLNKRKLWGYVFFGAGVGLIPTTGGNGLAPVLIVAAFIFAGASLLSIEEDEA